MDAPLQLKESLADCYDIKREIAAIREGRRPA